MRTFGFRIPLHPRAAQWTIALSLIAFVGGAIGGLIVALARTAENRPRAARRQRLHRSSSRARRC